MGLLTVWGCCIVFLVGFQGFVVSNETVNPTKARVELGDWRTRGKLDLFYAGRWGAVCARRWGKEEAKVACRMLGFNGTSVTPSTAYVYQHRSRLERWVHVIDSCQGTEQSLDECGRIKKSYLCGMVSNHILVGVDCDPDPDYMVLRLHTADHEGAGVVELLRDSPSQVTNICGDIWSVREANVVCRQLGFSGKNSLPLEVNANLLRSGDGSILMSGVDCRGTEGNLGQCVYSPWGDVRCREQSGKAGVLCHLDAASVQVALRGGSVESEGWVVVKMLGKWMDLLQEQTSWSGLEASVICRMQGYKWGAVSSKWYNRDKTTRPSWRFYGHCSGEEVSLIRCNISKWRLDSHTPSEESRPTSVKCFNDSESPSRPVIFGLPNVVFENETVAVRCEVDGGDFDVTVALRCPGENSGNEGTLKLVTRRKVSLSTVVTGRDAIESDKPCECAAVNDMGWYASSHWRPDIIFGPAVVKLIQPKKIPQLGEIFPLICEVEMSNPPVQITWQNGTNIVEEAGRTYSRKMDNGYFKTYSQWYIRGDQSVTGNIITCLAQNPVTKATAFDSKVLSVGVNLPKSAHIGLVSSKLFSPSGLYNFLKSSVLSSYVRRRRNRVGDKYSQLSMK